MKLWVDAQISPKLADWISRHYPVEATAVRFLQLHDATDRAIFDAARAAGAAIITKDRDFVELLSRLGPPPQVVWVTCGNTSNGCMRPWLADAFPRVFLLLRQQEPLIEITGRESPVR